MSLSVISAPSPNFNARSCGIDTLVLHYTGMADGASALARMQDPEAQVSAHYMVEENGQVLSLVDETQRAWHAGQALWLGETNLNCRSIGIEIVNGGHDFGLPDFPDVQIDSVIALCQDILQRWPIIAARIVAHSDIAPDRKMDPGEKFPWRRLAKAGIGIYPDLNNKSLTQNAPSDLAILTHLTQIGYGVGASLFDTQSQQAVCAFQRRYLPEALGQGVHAQTWHRIVQIAQALAVRT